MNDDHPTLHRIDAAAVESFFKSGYHASSMRKIAALAQVQAASMYHWYPSKEELLVHLMTQFMDGLSREVESALEGVTDPVERMARAVRAHVAYHGNHRETAFVADTEVRALTGPARTTVMERRDAYQKVFRDLIQAGVDMGRMSCPDVRVTTFAVLLQCTGVAAWFQPDGPLPLEQVADAHVELVLNALCARPASDDGGRDAGA